MNTNIREDLMRCDILSSSDRLESYLLDINNNPDARLNLLIKAIKLQNYIVTLPLEKICEIAGIKYYPPPSKEIVSQHLNYLINKTGQVGDFTPLDISDSPTIESLQAEVSENLIVGNMNLNLVETAERLDNKADFIFYSDVIETIFFSYHSDELINSEANKLLSKITGKEINCGLVAITKTGEKYLYPTSNQEAGEILSGSMKKATLIMKWGLYTVQSPYIHGLGDVAPDIIIYNNGKDLSEEVEKHLGLGEIFDHLFIRIKNHPFNILLLQDRNKVIHFLSSFGDSQIQNVMERIVKQGKILDIDKFEKNINNVIYLWLNLPRNINWIQEINKMNNQNIADV